MRWRFIFIIFVFGTLYSVLVFHLYNIQIVKNLYYSARAQFLSEAGVLEKYRGDIYFIDKNNNLIQAALNKDYDMIYAVPSEIQKEAKLNNSDTADWAEKLSPILNVDAVELEKKINKQNDSYELLILKAGEEQIKQIQELNLKGIYIDKRNLRFYPFGELASQLLGFVSIDKQEGRYGLESRFDSFLQSNGLITTIDWNIQAQTEEILRKLVERWEAKSATAIVQDPKTGKILAMANFPNFEPNDYPRFDIGDFLNPAVQAVYEPGSVFKIFTMAAGIDSGKITPETVYFDSGSVTLNGKTIRNWDHKAYGKTTMAEVIEHSINTGSVYAERMMGHDIFYNYFVKFGFNALTEINLPGEVKGNIGNLKNGRDIDFATASYGQGVSVTPVRLISAVSAIANGGVIMKPLISVDEKPEAIRRIISEDSARAVAGMMVSAVRKNIIADIANYSVAGKTGTAYIPDFKVGGYTEDVINTYTGFAPASDPKFVILIKLEKPKNAPVAGQTVVPAFRELAQFILNYYNVAPDEL